MVLVTCARNGYVSSLIHLIGIKFFSGLVSLITGQRFTDTTSGFIVVSRPCCAFLARCLPSDYPEIVGLISVQKAGYSVTEVSVMMRPRLDDQSSIGVVDAFYYVFKVTLAILMGASRQREDPECLK